MIASLGVLEGVMGRPVSEIQLHGETAKSENEEHGTLAQKMTEKGALGYHTTAE